MSSKTHLFCHFVQLYIIIMHNLWAKFVVVYFITNTILFQIHNIHNKTATIIAATNSTIGPFAQSAQATAPQALQQWSLPPASNLTTISPQEGQPQPPQQPIPNGSGYDDIKPSFAKIAKFDFGPSGSFYDDDATDDLNGSDDINKSSISTSSANMVSNSRDPMQPRQRK